MKLVTSFADAPLRTDWKHQYIRYRLGRLKHQYWLRNRKNPNKFQLDIYDYFIIQNLKPGTTCIFGSAGYYLEDVIDNLTVVEMHPVVKTFVPTVHIVDHRDQIQKIGKFDNFIVTNNRGDHWVDLHGFSDHLRNYTKAMNHGGLLFYSFRDTQTHGINRLNTDLYRVFYDWAQLQRTYNNLHLRWYDIKFREIKQPFAGLENPDVVNGNLKFIFQFQENTWAIDDGCLIDNDG